MSAVAVPDVASLIDIASATDPTPAPAEETPVESTEVETPETPEGGEVETKTTPEGEKSVDGRTNPDAIRKALKAFRESSPENAPVAKALNDGYGRYLAYKNVFPKVADAQNAKAILDAVGGNDGITGLQNTIKSVNETDSLLYAGDPKVIDNLIEDFKRENKLDAFGKLATPFLDKLQQTDPKAYLAALHPHFVQGLTNAAFPDTVQYIMEQLGGEKPNIQEALKTLTGMQQWFEKQKAQVANLDKSKLDPDRQAFEKERTEFQTTKQKEFRASVNTDWNRENNKVLGESLKPYLKLPFAKNWTDGTKQSVAREITSTLLEELTADKPYQSQMDAFWSEKSPDKAKIINFHKSKVAIIGPRIVKQVLENRYPGFQKSAVPMKPKPAAGGSVQTTTQRPAVKAIYVPTRIPAEFQDMSKDPDRMLLATGRAYDKRDGKLKSWNPRDKQA
jgi:hypothetical protein